MDEGEARKQVQRAVRARRLAEDELIKELFDNIERGLIDQMKFSKLGDDETRYHARVGLGILENFRAQFATWMADGKIAARDLKQLRKARNVR